jgi:hypothetical protein
VSGEPRPLAGGAAITVTIGAWTSAPEAGYRSPGTPRSVPARGLSLLNQE